MDVFREEHWQVSLHILPDGATAFIPITVILVLGEDHSPYLARPYGHLTSRQKVQYDSYVAESQSGSCQIIPRGMGILGYLIVDDSVGISETIQSRVNKHLQAIYFIDGDLKGNFMKLRDHYELNESGQHKKDVSTLIKGFTIRFPSGAQIDYTIPEDDSSKPGLLIHHFSGGRDGFEMNNVHKFITRKYFGNSICNGKEVTTDMKYTPIAQALLETGVTIEIRRPQPQAK